jgi:hypothetical protein
MRIRSMEEKIIGYDVREMWYKEPCDFRMGSKLVKMLSIDQTLWSSIFHHGGYGDLVGKDREEKGFGMIELPDMSRVGINYHLWSDLADMQNFLRPYRCAEGKPYWVVAITLRTEDLEAESRDKEYWPYEPESNPDSIQSDWVLVGYDLTSRWSESMITPVLFSPETEAEDVAELTRELNEYLLFPSIEKAVEFKMRWDTAFPDPAPHLVYGIWRIEEARYRPR